MSTQDNGGPAFPSPELRGVYTQFGMTLRDYFAAKAMQAVIAAHGELIAEMKGKDCDTLAVVAYVFADSMLKARQQ